MNRKFHFLSTGQGEVDAAIEILRHDKATIKHKPAILLATDGTMVAAEDQLTGESIRCPFNELHRHFGFFLPAAGMRRYTEVCETEVDVRATGKLARLYDALLNANPTWATVDKRHALNKFMTRLIFCLFSEDVGIIGKTQFTKLIAKYSGYQGAEAHIAITQAFKAMNRRTSEREALPTWTQELPYVNGAIFKGPIECPHFDATSWGHFRDSANLNWRDISPDIFGSMIQTIAVADKRSELGLHYTSTPNILKVIGPLFLDDLKAEIRESWGNLARMESILKRLGRIKIFDPACGSGNFLVIAYRELRALEFQLMEGIKSIQGKSQGHMWSSIPLSNFYGIELADFAAETAKLALIIAECQANSQMADTFGATGAPSPLRTGANIVCGNALQADWDQICPPPIGSEELYIAGNPPYLGKAQQKAHHKIDKDKVFGPTGFKYKAFDYVIGWLYKAGQYIEGRRVQAAFVSTSSICQGDHAATAWPIILGDTREIGFAHRAFKWQNNAAHKATAMCVIISIRNKSTAAKKLIEKGVEVVAKNINSYLLNMPDIVVSKSERSIFGLANMLFGNMPYGGGLLMTPSQLEDLLEKAPDAHRFVRRFMGADEVVKGKQRYCLWIDDDQVEIAKAIAPVADMIEANRMERLRMKDRAGRNLASRPHQFREHHAPERSAILVPGVTSERRQYLPVDLVGPDVITSNLNFVLYDVPEWNLALIASRLHYVWIATVCGRRDNRLRYANTLGWNTFPVPKFTEDQIESLNKSARTILKTRYLHHPKTIADLYDPDTMPQDLRDAHQCNDELVETIYLGRPFTSDRERIETLFELYSDRVRYLKANGQNKEPA